MEKTFLGSFNNYFHDIGGDIYSMGDSRLLIEKFKYDGTGPDAFFWAGTKGKRPSSVGILLAHPFRGKFYDYDDQTAPILERRFTGKVSRFFTAAEALRSRGLVVGSRQEGRRKKEGTKP